jgi:hypothetical protein
MHLWIPQTERLQGDASMMMKHACDRRSMHGGLVRDCTSASSDVKLLERGAAFGYEHTPCCMCQRRATPGG